MRLYPLAYSAALLPLFTIHLCYVVAASYGHVDWCIPYIDSCTSISAGGRHPPEFFLFKALMLPTAVILLCYWLCCERWLAALSSRPERRYWGLLTLAVISSLGLILYSVMLGAIGDAYRLQRRIGVTTFFGFSYLAQLLINYRLSQVTISLEPLLKQKHWLTFLSILVLVVGLASVVFNAIDEDYYDTKEDAFEWSLTLLLCLHALVTGRLWQTTGFKINFKLNGTND